MSDEHPLLASSEDSVFAILLVWPEQTDNAVTGDMEACCRILKERFHDSNCVQTMTQIPAIEKGDAAAKCKQLFTLLDAIERNGGKYGSHHELATLAALTGMIFLIIVQQIALCAAVAAFATTSSTSTGN